MAFTTTSNFAGKAAGFYISAALKSAVSLDYLTMIENIKFKSNIQKMDATVSPRRILRDCCNGALDCRFVRRRA